MIRMKELSPNPVQIEIPGFLMNIVDQLQNAGFEAYVVGGAVRDICLKRPVMDWDVTTSASPDQIKSLFFRIRQFSLKHGTVTLVDKRRNYEVTTFRGAGGVCRTLEEDLSHRDFTINAMAYDTKKGKILDPYGGRSDLLSRLVRAVNSPEDRFQEDPVRLLRAVRIATELDYKIEQGTIKAISLMKESLASVAMERIRDELMKILLSQRPSRGFHLMHRTGLLTQILPELLEGYLKRQNRHHQYTIYRHIMETIDRIKPDPVLRLTALLHDIAKPRVRMKLNSEFRFFGHEEASAKLAEDIMERLRLSKKMIRKVTNLISLHMIGYDSGWSNGAVRRLIRRAGPDNMEQLLSFRRADLLAHGRIDRKMDQLSELEKRVEELRKGSLLRNRQNMAIDGNMVMEIMEINPGPAVAKILDMLMERVTDTPELNTKDRLVALLEEIKRDGFD